MRDYNIIKTYIFTNSINILNRNIKPHFISIDIDLIWNKFVKNSIKKFLNYVMYLYIFSSVVFLILIY